MWPLEWKDGTPSIFPCTISSCVWKTTTKKYFYRLDTSSKTPLFNLLDLLARQNAMSAGYRISLHVVPKQLRIRLVRSQSKPAVSLVVELSASTKDKSALMKLTPFATKMLELKVSQSENVEFRSGTGLIIDFSRDLPIFLTFVNYQVSRDKDEYPTAAIRIQNFCTEYQERRYQKTKAQAFLEGISQEAQRNASLRHRNCQTLSQPVCSLK